MYKIIWVSIGHGYRSEQNQTYPTRAEADAECARLNSMWAGTITHWAVEDIDNAERHMPAVIEFLKGVSIGPYPDSDLESLHKAYQSVARALLAQIFSDSDGGDA